MAKAKKPSSTPSAPEAPPPTRRKPPQPAEEEKPVLRNSKPTPTKKAADSERDTVTEKKKKAAKGDDPPEGAGKVISREDQLMSQYIEVAEQFERYVTQAKALLRRAKRAETLADGYREDMIQLRQEILVTRAQAEENLKAPKNRAARRRDERAAGVKKTGVPRRR